MTPDEIAEIEKLAEAATPGPWRCRRALYPVDGEYDFGIRADIDGRGYCIAEAFGRADDDVRPDAQSNAAFIAAAREAVPKLIAALREARAECVYLREEKVVLEASLTAARADEAEAVALKQNAEHLLEKAEREREEGGR